MYKITEPSQKIGLRVVVPRLIAAWALFFLLAMGDRVRPGRCRREKVLNINHMKYYTHNTKYVGISSRGYFIIVMVFSTVGTSQWSVACEPCEDHIHSSSLVTDSPME